MYLKVARTDEDTSPDSRKVVYEKVNSRWEVCVTVSNNGFQQASFVNSIATTKVCILVYLTFLYTYCTVVIESSKSI